MNILELRMNYTAFIKLRDFVKITDISAEIKEYIKNNDVLEGKLDVNGTFLKEDLEKSGKFNQEIPFVIVFNDSNYDVLDLDCVNLDYHIVDGRGVEIEFDVKVRYEDLNEEETNESKDEENIIEIPVVVEEPIEEIIENVDDETFERAPMVDNKIEETINNEKNIEEVEIEKIKEEKTNEIDELIASKLSFVDNNLPPEVDLSSSIPEARSSIKVCYYKDDNDLERVCLKKDVGIDKVFKDNKNTEFNKYRRIIIK